MVIKQIVHLLNGKWKIVQESLEERRGWYGKEERERVGCIWGQFHRVEIPKNSGYDPKEFLSTAQDSRFTSTADSEAKRKE